MFDIMIIVIFIFLAAVLAFDSFRKWRSSQKILYLVGIGAFMLAAMSAIVDWSSSIFFILGGMVVRVIAQNTGNRNVSEVETSKSDEGDLS